MLRRASTELARAQEREELEEERKEQEKRALGTQEILQAMAADAAQAGIRDQGLGFVV
jgi:hypothetical protein